MAALTSLVYVAGCLKQLNRIGERRQSSCEPPCAGGERWWRRDAMRILFVAPYIPSPVRVRPYQWIRALARHGHRVRLVALQPPEDRWLRRRAGQRLL